jgi:hypothetical protein
MQTSIIGNRYCSVKKPMNFLNLNGCESAATLFQVNIYFSQLNSFVT